MSGISNQSLAVLKKNSGASRVGASDGETVEARLSSADLAIAAVAESVGETDLAVAAVVESLGVTDLAVAAVIESVGETDLAVAAVASDLADTDLAVAGKFDSSDVINEDDFSSDSETKVPTQSSVKAFVEASGAVALISSVTVDTPVAAIDVALSGYSRFIIRFDGMLPVNNSSYLYARTSADDGATFFTGGYRDEDNYSYEAQCRLNWDPQHNASGGVSGSLDITNVLDSGLPLTIERVSLLRASAADYAVTYQGAFTRDNVETTDTFRFYFNSGNIKAGRISLYGVNV